MGAYLPEGNRSLQIAFGECVHREGASTVAGSSSEHRRATGPAWQARCGLRQGSRFGCQRFPFPEFRVRWGWVLYLERKTLLVRANISPQTISLGTIRERISQPLGAVRGTHSNWIVFHPLFKAQSLSQQTEPVSHIGVAMTIVIQKTALKEIKISPEIRHRSAKKPS